MKSLAIEREFGSGGRAIGMEVAKRAGIPYYDGELLLKAAEEQGVPVDLFRYYDEKRSGSLLYDVAAFTDYAQGNNKNTVYELFSEIKKTIERLEKTGPAVFIGRCSTDILKKRTGVLKAFVYSSDQQKRVARIVETEGLTEAEAKKQIAKKDKERKNYFRFWTGKEWKDAGNYDLQLNTSALSVDECARMLLGVMEA